MIVGWICIIKVIYLGAPFLLVIEEQEVLRLEIPVEDPHGVTAVDGGDDLAEERGSGALPAHVLDVVALDELPRDDGLAGEALPDFPVRVEVRRPELALPQLMAEGVGRAQVLHGPPEHAPRRPCVSRRLRLLLRQGLLVLRRRRRRRRRLGQDRRGRLLLGGPIEPAVPLKCSEKKRTSRWAGTI